MQFPTAETSKQLVRNSWERCQQAGLKPSDPADDQIITENQIKQLKEENHLLLEHAETVLNKVLPAIEVSEHVLLMVDPKGHIIYSAGHTDFATKAQRVQLQVGANWNEDRKGTNAIGVALMERESNIIIGGQHFYEENHFLSCAASPIYDSAGELLGVVDISSRYESFSPSSFMFATMIAESIQNKILLEETKSEHLLTLKELEVTSNNHPKPIISINEERRIVRANQAARRLLGDNCTGKPFKGLQGFEIETILDRTRKQFRSVAVYDGGKKPTKTNHYHFSDIIGSCPSIQRVKKTAQKAAFYHYNVFITGESGTGKELIAQSIHNSGERAGKPFVAVNCSAIPDSLIESELFGYEAGSFTGANRSGKKGKFEAAQGGTIFLDEIGDMSLRGQAALLRVLQEKTIMPVGAVTPKAVDVRIISATHRDLLEEVKKGNFREDLYYRLKEITLSLPSLRERTDVGELAQYFLNKEYHGASLTEKAAQKIQEYHWPGNIRELRSMMVQALFHAEEKVVDAEHLHFESNEPPKQAPLTLKQAEKSAIENALHTTEGNVSHAARILGVGRNTLYRKMKEYHL
ncbi:sigma-54-dependent Fis family transcriptional regulator [Bacillus tianshenii]|nr:sigma-54-dependent Fis family transcriptional regulator [Bacillus tianshenii]